MGSEEGSSECKKHGIPFSDAIGVFEDPRAATVDDPHPDEQRFATLGLDFLGRVLVVCWTPRGDDIRIFSARRATPSERENYGQEE